MNYINSPKRPAQGEHSIYIPTAPVHPILVRKNGTDHDDAWSCERETWRESVFVWRFLSSFDYFSQNHARFLEHTALTKNTEQHWLTPSYTILHQIACEFEPPSGMRELTPNRMASIGLHLQWSTSGRPVSLSLSLSLWSQLINQPPLGQKEQNIILSLFLNFNSFELK